MATEHKSAFGWHFDATREHATRQELIDAHVISEATTHEDLFWIRHRVGEGILDQMRMLTRDRDQLIRSRAYWLWLRRLWLKYDRERLRLMAEHTSGVLFVTAPRSVQLERLAAVAQLGDSTYEPWATAWFGQHRFMPNRALLKVVRDQNADKAGADDPDALLDATKTKTK